VVHSCILGFPSCRRWRWAPPTACFTVAAASQLWHSEVFIKSSDDYSHGFNERIPVQSFYDGLEFWYRLMQDFAAPNLKVADGTLRWLLLAASLATPVHAAPFEAPYSARGWSFTGVLIAFKTKWVKGRCR